MASAFEIGNVTDDFSMVCTHDGDAPPTTLPLRVLTSAAGPYLGTICPRCGPNSRVSGYFVTKRGRPDFDAAEAALAATLAGDRSHLRDSAYHPGTLTFVQL